MNGVEAVAAILFVVLRSNVFSLVLGKCHHRFSLRLSVIICFMLHMMPSKKIFNIAAFPFHLLGSEICEL